MKEGNTWLPRRDALDKQILGIALPSIANLAVIPVVGAVDTLWIGRMGDALALAGQGAANQVFFSTFFLVSRWDRPHLQQQHPFLAHLPPESLRLAEAAVQRVTYF